MIMQDKREYRSHYLKRRLLMNGMCNIGPGHIKRFISCEEILYSQIFHYSGVSSRLQEVSGDSSCSLKQLHTSAYEKTALCLFVRSYSGEFLDMSPPDYLKSLLYQFVFLTRPGVLEERNCSSSLFVVVLGDRFV
ncbi:hypothetical protein CSKR_200626 [Clonorchis sinensis]|uniref:Uncharacterized protein n=1 Tax=Clonorchis sinensis TaxID=79923 RepID=A0A8T1MFF4_CLOSI|nr:hypothetical protein CSKR_200626 [Clonorchis sinensis]